MKVKFLSLFINGINKYISRKTLTYTQTIENKEYTFSTRYRCHLKSIICYIMFLLINKQNNVRCIAPGLF